MATPREPAHPLERLIFFSDAVFAIAITLLVIEIEVPHLPHAATNLQHAAALANLLPNFVGFFISFWVIGAFWTGHHRAFSLARYYAPGLIMPNLAMLCAIAFMPFGTAYMSENFGETVPHALYNGLLLVTALLNLRVVRKVTGTPYLGEDADPQEVALTRVRPWGVIGASALAFALSFIAPLWSQFALVTIPLWIMVAARGANLRPAAAQ